MSGETPAKPRYMSGWVALLLINLAGVATVAALLLVGVGIDQVFFGG